MASSDQSKEFEGWFEFRCCFDFICKQWNRLTELRKDDRKGTKEWVCFGTHERIPTKMPACLPFPA